MGLSKAVEVLLEKGFKVGEATLHISFKLNSPSESEGIVKEVCRMLSDELGAMHEVYGYTSRDELCVFSREWKGVKMYAFLIPTKYEEHEKALKLGRLKMVFSKVSRPTQWTLTLLVDIDERAEGWPRCIDKLLELIRDAVRGRETSYYLEIKVLS